MDFSDVISIPDYYKGQSIFVTGGTGFMGKVLIEKLLRSCPDVANVFVLIRPKKNVSVEERWSQITKLPLFDTLRSERPEALQKVILIPGDIRIPTLGLSGIHVKLLIENVTLLFHIAAMVQFTDSMCDAFQQNVLGTWKVLELAKRLMKLKAFVYVSSTYSNSNIPPEETGEEIIPACQNWRIVLKIVENSPLQLEFLREKLLCGHPNPYTWSKSLAEQAVNEYRNNFPTIIIRPAIVIATLNDPLPGWEDAANGFSVYGVLTTYGLLHLTPASGDSNFDYIPVDYSIKACLIAPWRQHIKVTYDEKVNMTEVYNCAFGKILSLNAAEILHYNKEIVEMYPPDRSVWVQSMAYIPNKTLFGICFLIYQVLPAALADFVLFIMGKPRMVVKLMIKVLNTLRRSSKLMNRRNAFSNERFIELGKCLKDEDRAKFAYDLNTIQKRELVRTAALGFRKYFMKEEFTEEANKKKRNRMKRIKTLHTIITSLTYFLAAYFLLTCFGGVGWTYITHRS